MAPRRQSRSKETIDTLREPDSGRRRARAGSAPAARRRWARQDRGAATIHGLFEEQVARSPDAPAVVFGDEEITYGELNARSNRLARHLRRLGVGPETLVALCLERSFEMVVGLIGVLKAGAAYVPIDSEYPYERVALILEDSAARFVLTQERLLDRLPVGDVEPVCVDRDGAAIRAESSENLSVEVRPLNLAYVIYTSGSTGRPKGVAVPHGGVCNFARAEQELFAIRPDERVLQFSALGFDASVEELTLALLNGAALYVPSETRRRWRLARVLEESAVTVASLPPSVLAELPELQAPALETVIVGGEACPPGVARTWSAGRRFFNGYGPTETSIVATCARIDDVGGDAVRVSIGCPLAGVTAYVLDADLNVAQDGRGELYIGGAGVVRGYLRQPGLTAERFLPDPFSPVPGARMYRSGDLVCRNDRGELEFLGRIDEQVKVNGFRIEPAEVEAALVDHADVRQAVVLAVEGRDGTKRLTAYVVEDDRRPASAPLDLRGRLLEKLPEYMVPADYVTLEELPLTPNGKVDRRALERLAGGPGKDSGGSPQAVEAVRSDGTYVVVVNAEEQYSIWPADRRIPRGWNATGEVDLLDACLSYIDGAWTDMRPGSLRDAP